MPAAVDELVAAWRRERGDLDLAPVEIFSRISRLSRHLDRARRQAFTAHDIEPWAFDVLAALRRAGPPYHPSPGRLLPAAPGPGGVHAVIAPRHPPSAAAGRPPKGGSMKGVEVPAPGPRRRVAEGEDQVGQAIGADMGDALPVPPDFDRLDEAGERDQPLVRAPRAPREQTGGDRVCPGRAVVP